MKNIKTAYVVIKDYGPGAAGKLHAEHATAGGAPTGYESRIRVPRRVEMPLGMSAGIINRVKNITGKV
jgi:hypothetical protein